MSIRTEHYKKSYNLTTSGDHEDRGDLFVIGKVDKIAERLSHLCIVNSINVDKQRCGVGEFIWFEGGLFYIEVTSERYERQYTKYVTIQAMPKDVKLPKELSDLIREEGFEEEVLT